MIRLFLLCLLPIGFVSCDNKAGRSTDRTESVSKNAWYSSWISEDRGERFRSEQSLAPGEVTSVSIPSDTSLVVGFVVEKGYEISKSFGTIYMGTNDTPHAMGASTGTWNEFKAANNSVTIRFENTSAIPTRLAIYTKPTK